MKVHLLYEDQDFDSDQPLPANESDLTHDFALDTLFEGMAAGDQFLFDTARRVILSPLDSVPAIRYRQAVLEDCIRHPELVRQLYGLAVEAIARQKRQYPFGISRYPDGVLAGSIRVLRLFMEMLVRLRASTAVPPDTFRSAGFQVLFRTLSDELNDAYVAEIDQHLRRLDANRWLMSARLGPGNVSDRHVLRRPHRSGLLDRLVGDRAGYEFSIDPQDEHGSQALAELKNRGIALAATALARSADHNLSFFVMLRFELAFYVACLNLHERLQRQGQALCFPEPRDPGTTDLNARELYDPCLSLAGVQPVVGSNVDLDGKKLLVITGANRGGKSTFLRALGLAQLMMQSGMFVAADSFRAEVCTGVFSHYRREEDRTMTRGKLDDELKRMGTMADLVRPGGLILFNESFSSTNEREGSEIARQIVHALLDAGVKVAYVTHMFDLAHSLWKEERTDAVFLRAHRLADGTRTFKLVEGEPLPTSHGQDMYARIFGSEALAAVVGGASS
jgi:hypothetical protein